MENKTSEEKILKFKIKNEYLFLSEEHRDEVEAYKPDGVTVEISNVENTPLWVAAYLL